MENYNKNLAGVKLCHTHLLAIFLTLYRNLIIDELPHNVSSFR